MHGRSVNRRASPVDDLSIRIKRRREDETIGCHRLLSCCEDSNHVIVDCDGVQSPLAAVPDGISLHSTTMYCSVADRIVTKIVH
jgi:hypothetical protein